MIRTIGDENNVDALAERLYLNTDVDIWQMLYDWLDAHIK